MINRKAKGTKGERDIVAMFWQEGWAAIRSPGSGAMRQPSPDIVAGTSNRKIAIECKITKEKKKYIPTEEIDDLLKFSRIFNAEPWIALKFPNTDWLFVIPEDMDRTERAYTLSQEKARLKGVLFSEMIQKEKK